VRRFGPLVAGVAKGAGIKEPRAGAADPAICVVYGRRGSASVISALSPVVVPDSAHLVWEHLVSFACEQTSHQTRNFVFPIHLFEDVGALPRNPLQGLVTPNAIESTLFHFTIRCSRCGHVWPGSLLQTSGIRQIRVPVHLGGTVNSQSVHYG
jgi:hypothetical protein